MLSPEEVYVCDERGERVSDSSDYVAFEINPDQSVAVMQTAAKTEWVNSYYIRLSLNRSKALQVGNKVYNELSVSYNAIEDWICPEADAYVKDSYIFENGDEDITLQRALFTPDGAKEDGGKNPLIVWLHGLAEGGTDINIPLLNANTTALSSPEIQEYFTDDTQGGAYVAVIQTPTMWLDTDGKGSDGLNVYTGNGQTSYYTQALNAAIDDYVFHNGDIDASRIYIAGCSNGGFMALNLAENYGDKYAAYVPICEAYMNGNITEEILQKLKDLNIWFIQSDDDTTVDPFSHVIPTYYRLIHTGAENVNLSLLTGYGHGCWAAFFDDAVSAGFDSQKVLEDYANLTFGEHGEISSSSSYYVNVANCTENKGSVFAWLAEQGSVK